MSREKFHLKHRWKGKALQSWKRYIQQHEFSESVTETMTETHGTVSSPVLIRGIHHYDDIQVLIAVEENKSLREHNNEKNLMPFHVYKKTFTRFRCLDCWV